MEEKNYLCFIKFIGKKNDNTYSYDLLFTEEIDTFWGEGFEVIPCSLCSEMIPNEDSYNAIKRINIKYELSLVQNSCCNSMQDCMDGIISLGWCYDKDENFLFKFDYGIEYDEVIKIIEKINS